MALREPEVGPDDTPPRRPPRGTTTTGIELLPTPRLRTRPADLTDTSIVVVSPHLDDAVLSLGATIAFWSAAGVDVTILTVFANDPEASGPARPWDAAGGYVTAAEAAMGRRDEDAIACGLVGARPVWLPYGDADNGRHAADTEVLMAVTGHLSDADAVLVPGAPLVNPDHRDITRLVLGSLDLAEHHLGFYLEQPYAIGHTARTRRLRRPPPPAAAAWSRSRPPLACWRAKHRAVSAYRSQIPLLSRFLRTRIAAWELAHRGESVAWAR